MFEVFVPPSCMLMAVVNWLIELDVEIGGDVVLQDDFSEAYLKWSLKMWMTLWESCLAKSDNEQWRRAEVEKHDKNLQNLKSSFDPLDTFAHPYRTIQPMNKCTDTNMIGMLYGDKQGKRYQIWLDCISISQIGSDSWLMKFAKWESTGEDRYCCLTTVLLITKQVEESFTWLHTHQIWLDDLEANGEHKNDIHSYSWDHKIEVENFKEISLIWDKIYELQLGYSSDIYVAAPFYWEALLPVQDPVIMDGFGPR
ncbi:hypothetical protein V6N13_010061 [Hibiscus sabdariffa]